jgi:hypothetical protein
MADLKRYELEQFEYEYGAYMKESNDGDYCEYSEVEQYANAQRIEELILFNNKLLKRLKCMSPEHYSILKEIIFENQERIKELKEVKQP